MPQSAQKGEQDNFRRLQGLTSGKCLRPKPELQKLFIRVRVKGKTNNRAI